MLLLGYVGKAVVTAALRLLLSGDDVGDTEALPGCNPGHGRDEAKLRSIAPCMHSTFFEYSPLAQWTLPLESQRMRFS